MKTPPSWIEYQRELNRRDRIDQPDRERERMQHAAWVVLIVGAWLAVATLVSWFSGK